MGSYAGPLAKEICRVSSTNAKECGKQCAVQGTVYLFIYMRIKLIFYSYRCEVALTLGKLNWLRVCLRAWIPTIWLLITSKSIGLPR